MVWFFLTRCCSYDWQTWTMETLLAAHAFRLLFYTISNEQQKAKTWNFVAVVVFFLKCSYTWFVFSSSLVCIHTLSLHTVLLCPVFCNGTKYNVSSFSHINVCVCLYCTSRMLYTLYSYTVNVYMHVCNLTGAHLSMYLFDIFAPI